MTYQAYNLTNVVMLGVILASLWVFYFWLYRSYCIDKTRQDLFALRDELFDYAASGGIAFEHPAYCHLRRTINGIIRFTHKLDLINLICLSFVKPPQNIPNVTVTISKVQSEEAKKKLNEIFIQANMIIFSHLTRVSILLMITAIILGLFILAKQGIKNIKTRIAGEFPGLKTLEEFAAAEAP